MRALRAVSNSRGGAQGEAALHVVSAPNGTSSMIRDLAVCLLNLTA
jgi:hypothetical protein